MSTCGIMNHYFFEDVRGRAVTVNSEHNVEVLDRFFPGYNQRILFQQAGATSHLSNTSLLRVS